MTLSLKADDVFLKLVKKTSEWNIKNIQANKQGYYKWRPDVDISLFSSASPLLFFLFLKTLLDFHDFTKLVHLSVHCYSNGYIGLRNEETLQPHR